VAIWAHRVFEQRWACSGSRHLRYPSDTVWCRGAVGVAPAINVCRWTCQKP